MIIVLDPSAAIEILLNKEDASVYAQKIAEADIVIAPELYFSKVSNVAWKYNKLANFTREEALDLSTDGINLVDQFIPTIDIWKESLREAINNDHAVYDCLYLVCARRNDGLLLTKDKKLKKLCKKLKVQVF